MLGWITSLYGLIHSAVNFLFDVVDKAVHLVVTLYTFAGFVLTMITDNLTSQDPWTAALFAPVILFAAVFVSIAIIRLIISMGGH